MAYPWDSLSDLNYPINYNIFYCANNCILHLFILNNTLLLSTNYTIKILINTNK